MNQFARVASRARRKEMCSTTLDGGIARTSEVNIHWSLEMITKSKIVESYHLSQ